MSAREALERLIDRIPATANAEREYEIVAEAVAELERVSRSNEELRGEVEIKNEEISTLTAALDEIDRYEVDWTQGVDFNVESVKDIARRAGVTRPRVGDEA
jgi:hypothetical protein